MSESGDNIDRRDPKLVFQNCAEVRETDTTLPKCVPVTFFRQVWLAAE